MEDVADALLHGSQAADVLVVGAQGGLVLYLEPRHHHVDALRVQLGEAHPAFQDEQMPRMLHVVLVVGVVHDALQVALVVAYPLPIFEDVFHVVGLFFRLQRYDKIPTPRKNIFPCQKKFVILHPKTVAPFSCPLLATASPRSATMSIV